MNYQDFRDLQEAYLEVVENQQLDEEERPIYGRGGKLRRTETPLEVLGKHATARDKRTKHNIPRGGRTFPAGKPDEGNPSSLFSGEYDRGKGSKAARRAAALKKPEPKKSFPNRLRRSDGQGIRDSYDYYDIIFSHLLDEGYAETPEAAEVIMVNMSEEWRQSIVEAPGEWFGGLRDRARASKAAQIQSMQSEPKPGPNVSSPFAKPASRTDSGKLTTYGAGGGAAAERSGQTRSQVMQQGAKNLETRNKSNPGPNFGR
jgi:hypothetical protein